MFFRIFGRFIVLFSVSACGVFKPHEPQGSNTPVEVVKVSPSLNIKEDLPSLEGASPDKPTPPPSSSDSDDSGGGSIRIGNGGGLVPSIDVDPGRGSPNFCFADKDRSC